MIEIIAAILTLISAGFATFEKRETWGIGIFSCIFYMIFFYEIKMWGMFSLQILLIGQSISGYFSWKKLKLKSLSNQKLIRGFFIFTLLFIPVAFMILADKFTWIELAVCWISILANWMLIEGDPRSWNIWIIVNITSIILFTLVDWAPISAITYTILLINSIIASWKWHKKLGKTVFY